ncbi:MAG: glucoamylase family protein [Bacteroidota bacterium]
MRLVLIYVAVASLVAGCNSHKSSKKEVSQNSSQSGSEWSNTALMDTVQKQTFEYFWTAAEPVSGLARERLHMDNEYPHHPKNVITTGGSGFGLMAIIVGVERGFINRNQALDRFEKVLDFLEQADRFHGAWPHWLKPNGKTYPFSTKDDGGDLVETAFLIQGLLTVKEYMQTSIPREQDIADRIQKLWEEVEWNWYTKNGEEVLYWHWSPNYDWEMNFPVGGYNECLIMYVLAASSPTHGISKQVYENGWARSGAISKDTVFYELNTELDHYEHDDAPVGPLFWAHYSYLGLNPKGLSDQYADYWKLNTNHARIHYKYAMDNPEGHKGYGQDCWGLTSSYSMKGYAGHRPLNDPGVISPTAALSSMPYTPQESLNFLRYMYTEQDSLIGEYGPYDAFSQQNKWYLPRYLAIDQGPIPVMVENHRTGLLWDIFMKNKDVQNGLKKLGFSSPYFEKNE